MKLPSLPLSIDDIPYRDSVRGDLIITRGTLYFFPRSEIEHRQLRKADLVVAASEYLGVIGAALSIIAELLSSELKTINNSALHRNGLWRQFDTNEEIQERLDNYIRSLARNQKLEEFSVSLPRPIRIQNEEIRKLQLNFRGRLVIETPYDTHDFNVGLKRRRLLREVLKKGEFNYTGRPESAAVKRKLR